MLKVLPPLNLSQQPKAKCGEIFCHSFTDFTIICCFCKMKLFAFEDFLLHIQNIHFENNLLKTNNTINYNEFEKTNDVKHETEQLVMLNDVEELESVKNVEEGVDSYTSEDDSSEEECIKVLNTTKRISKKIKIRKTITKNSIEVDHVNKKHQFRPKDEITNKHSTAKSKKNQKEEEYSCPECQQKFPHRKYMDRHVFDFHNGYKCSRCDKRFRLRHHLQRHEITHTAEKKFHCPTPECTKIFSDPEYLKRHLEMHTMSRNFVCEFENCGKAFHTERRLITHHYTHRIAKKFVCDMCGYSCRSNVTLSIHQRVHTGEKPFPCEVCEKRFVSKTALNEHMITHSSTREHVCEICQATFANYRILQRHKFIHSDKRTFKCKFCDKAFKQANGLDGHVRRLHREPNAVGVKK